MHDDATSSNSASAWLDTVNNLSLNDRTFSFQQQTSGGILPLWFMLSSKGTTNAWLHKAFCNLSFFSINFSSYFNPAFLTNQRIHYSRRKQTVNTANFWRLRLSYSLKFTAIAQLHLLWSNSSWGATDRIRRHL